jgi:hypothetical protein
MKTKELNIIEAITAAKAGFRVAFGQDKTEFTLQHDRGFDELGSTTTDPLFDDYQLEFITSHEWQIIVGMMSFDDACKYSQKSGLTMQRKTAPNTRLTVDPTGDIQCTSVNAGNIVRKLTLEETRANDWVPMIEHVTVSRYHATRLREMQ